MAEPHDRKPILTIEQQIEHLKQKGVAFELCSEEEAADYLRDKCNFFKLASYRKLFSKYEGGPRDGRYVDLDFGQLRLLAALDQELRHALLGMTLDIEHFQKVTLLREMEDRGEDGYAIVADYMASLTTANREYRLRELKMSGRSPYSSSLYAKYSGDMPAWAFLELTSFGTLIDFVRFCARRWGDRRLEASHYDLKRVKSVRNCAAHGVPDQLLRREGRRPGLGVQRRLPKGRRRGDSQGDQEEVDGEYGHAGGRDRARGALRLGTRGLLALARRIRARRDDRQGRRRNRGAARHGARRRSSLRARVPSQVDRIARVGRIACR